MKLRCGLLCSLFVALASVAFACPPTWYVDAVSGSNSNNCQSAESACKTINHAISLASAGDIIKIAAGTYNEFLTIKTSLHVVGAGSSKTIITASIVNGAIVTVAAHTAVTLTELTIAGASYSGTMIPGISNAGKLSMLGVIVTGNTGGGINNVGILNVNKSTISGNTFGYEGDGYGAGISCFYFPRLYGSSMRITNSTISGNSGAEFGGGIYTACPTTIINSTITGNTVFIIGGEGATGSGVFVRGKARVSINSSTIEGNWSLSEEGRGFGISALDGDNPGDRVRIQNTIIANNGWANCNPFHRYNSEGYNLISDDSCSFNNSGDLNNTDPMLGLLKYNGGPTQTEALLAGSPAIDSGNPAGCTDGGGNILNIDQRGHKRPGDPRLITGCDIGAFEFQFPK